MWFSSHTRVVLVFLLQLAFSKVKANLGLDQADSCFTGAAPISTEVRPFL
ncbi:unnamed protein product, partial [Hapterophycus canaliculatus]